MDNIETNTNESMQTDRPAFRRNKTETSDAPADTSTLTTIE